MRMEFSGVYGPNGTLLVDTREDLKASISQANPHAWDDLKAAHDNFDGLIDRFLQCYHHVAGQGANAQGKAMLMRLQAFLASPDDVETFHKTEVDLEDPEASLQRWTATQRRDQAFEELRDRTLLINALSADPASDARFAYALGRKVRNVSSDGGQLIPSSSLVAGPGRDIYRNLCGALYSGRSSPVYEAFGGDIASGNWAPHEWAQLTADRVRRGRSAESREALNLNKLASARGGHTDHNEVLALLYPENLLGLFFSSLEDVAGGARQPIADKQKASDATRDTRLEKLTTFVGSDPVPIFRFNPRNGSLTLMEPTASALPHKFSLRRLATA